MRHLVRLDDWTAEQVRHVFDLADAYAQGRGPTIAGCAAMFFPPTSLRTRITFERGAQLMGLQPVLFPPDTLDKPEALRDVAGYLSNWVDIAIVRHRDIAVLEDLASCDQLPVVNAMTNANHPCEVLSDVYALAQQGDYRGLRYLFIGAEGNIARAWQELARVLGLDLVQCCPPDLATPGARWTDDLDSAVRTADVILTDGVGPHADALAPFRVTAELLDLAPPGVRFAPCPPFIRGEELSADALTPNGPFVGYQFKKPLLRIHQAVMAHCLGAG